MADILQSGDKVVMKTNWNIVYILLTIENGNAICLHPVSNEKITFPLIAIEKYDAVRVFGL